MICDTDTDFPAIRPLGDACLLVEFGDTIDPSINKQVAVFAAMLREAKPNGVYEIVPTIKAVTVCFDPLAISGGDLSCEIDALLKRRSEATPHTADDVRHWRIPVCYDEAVAPDLAAMADACGLDARELIRQHGLSEQGVLMIGFAPGFLYSGLLPQPLHVPRRREITPEVPPGAVICAVGQTCIAATAMPTGWYQIGRSPLRNFQPEFDPPVAIKAGDLMTFQQIDLSELRRLDDARDAGNWQPERLVDGG